MHHTGPNQAYPIVPWGVLGANISVVLYLLASNRLWAITAPLPTLLDIAVLAAGVAGVLLGSILGPLAARAVRAVR